MMRLNVLQQTWDFVARHSLLHHKRRDLQKGRLIATITMYCTTNKKRIQGFFSPIKTSTAILGREILPFERENANRVAQSQRNRLALVHGITLTSLETKPLHLRDSHRCQQTKLYLGFSPSLKHERITISQYP